MAFDKQLVTEASDALAEHTNSATPVEYLHAVDFVADDVVDTSGSGTLYWQTGTVLLDLANLSVEATAAANTTTTTTGVRKSPPETYSRDYPPKENPPEVTPRGLHG